MFWRNPICNFRILGETSEEKQKISLEEYQNLWTISEDSSWEIPAGTSGGILEGSPGEICEESSGAKYEDTPVEIPECRNPRMNSWNIQLVTIERMSKENLGDILDSIPWQLSIGPLAEILKGILGSIPEGIHAKNVKETTEEIPEGTIADDPEGSPGEIKSWSLKCRKPGNVADQCYQQCFEIHIFQCNGCVS